MENQYLNGDQISSLKNQSDPSLESSSTQTAYVSSEALHQSKYDEYDLLESSCVNAHDKREFLNFYTSADDDLEHQGYYISKHTESETTEKNNANIAGRPPAHSIKQSDGSINSTSEQLYVDTEDLKHNEIYMYNGVNKVSDVNVRPTMTNIEGYDSNAANLKGYGGYELDALARLVLHKPVNVSDGDKPKTLFNEDRFEVMNSIAAFEDIVNSEGKPLSL